jgi:hypothetical protein
MAFLYPVTQQIKSYFAKDGSPLNGTLRFGVANQDPEATSVQVYWDVDGTQPAAQPIRVRNGYAIRGSTPSNVFADGDFSAIARDSRNRLVYTVPNSTDIQLALAVTGLGTASAVGITDAGGYFTSTNVEGALQEAGASLAALTAALTAALPAGMVMDWAAHLAAPSGWLFLSGLTIGSVASSATARANADTATLYTLLWNNYSNTELVIQDSAGTPTTRGASAANDFAANKRLPLPDARGRVRIGKDDMGGSTASRITNAGSGIVGTTLGAVGGTQTHALTAAQMTDHTHTASQGTHNHTQDAHGHPGSTADPHLHTFANLGSGAAIATAGAGVVGGASTNTGFANTNTLTIAGTTATNQAASAGAITINAASASTAHQNTQPAIIFSAIIKY